jgi:hypothetical protein
VGKRQEIEDTEGVSAGLMGGAGVKVIPYLHFSTIQYLSASPRQNNTSAAIPVQQLVSYNEHTP